MTESAALLDRAAEAERAGAADAAGCVATLRWERIKRESAQVQREIDRLQQDARLDEDELNALFRRKDELARRLEDLTQGNV